MVNKLAIRDFNVDNFDDVNFIDTIWFAKINKKMNVEKLDRKYFNGSINKAHRLLFNERNIEVIKDESITKTVAVTTLLLNTGITVRYNPTVFNKIKNRQNVGGVTCKNRRECLDEIFLHEFAHVVDIIIRLLGDKKPSKKQHNVQFMKILRHISQQQYVDNTLLLPDNYVYTSNCNNKRRVKRYFNTHTNEYRRCKLLKKNKTDNTAIIFDNVDKQEYVVNVALLYCK